MDDLRKRLADAGSTGPDKQEPLTVRKEGTFKLTVGELKKAAKTKKDHPYSAIFLKACGTFPDDHDLYVERIDLEALLDGKLCKQETVIEETEEGGTVKVKRKKLVPLESENSVTPVKKSSPAPAPTPETGKK